MEFYVYIDILPLGFGELLGRCPKIMTFRVFYQLLWGTEININKGIFCFYGIISHLSIKWYLSFELVGFRDFTGDN